MGGGGELMCSHVQDLVAGARAVQEGHWLAASKVRVRLANSGVETVDLQMHIDDIYPDSTAQSVQRGGVIPAMTRCRRAGRAPPAACFSNAPAATAGLGAPSVADLGAPPARIFRTHGLDKVLGAGAAQGSESLVPPRSMTEQRVALRGCAGGAPEWDVQKRALLALTAPSGDCSS